MKSKHILLYLMIFLTMEAWAQKEITGKVTDFNTSETLPGVTILVRGDNSTGTITDIEGFYRITVPDSRSTLSYSFIGYTTEEVFVGEQTVINV